MEGNYGVSPDAPSTPGHDVTYEDASWEDVGYDGGFGTPIADGSRTPSYDGEPGAPPTPGHDVTYEEASWEDGGYDGGSGTPIADGSRAGSFDGIFSTETGVVPPGSTPDDSKTIN